MRVFESLEDVRAAADTDLGVSDWHVVSQQQIDAFADATGDHQWIHIDAERAAAGPFGTTIAHGFLTLSLTPTLLHEIYDVRGVGMAINYGANRVRFPAPLPSGSRVRARGRLDSVDDVPGGIQIVTHVEIEREGGDKPCCVADLVSRFLA
ncbi:MAG: MaoC family dehydratase [Candidatus Dormibacteraeota bacterium]|uniref:MaoC family dehydratase n=1 Tax=Candidatus Aeolococcus gillhamiae TaxID=3127015 RepID=A0A934K236_9BACT|nr:MaoC family dehydratase [Candidatus Dormibacteraeota bacterium]